MKKDILYLGSQSPHRKKMLDESKISCMILGQHSNEQVVQDGLSFNEYVQEIACDKMDHVELPQADSVAPDYMFVLTADSLVRTSQTNQILGKPKDQDDAKRMLRLVRTEPAEVATACCLHRKIKHENKWVVEQQALWVTNAFVELMVEEHDLERYFKNAPAYVTSCGGGVIEDFGQQYVKSVKGSYTAVKGLPLYELRENLEAMNFIF
jgi:septum formation protein